MNVENVQVGMYTLLTFSGLLPTTHRTAAGLKMRADSPIIEKETHITT